MNSHIIGISAALICLYLINRKWLAFLVSFAIVALIAMANDNQFSGNTSNPGALPEILAGILGFYIVDFAVAFGIYYGITQFKKTPQKEDSGNSENIVQEKVPSSANFKANKIKKIIVGSIVAIILILFSIELIARIYINSSNKHHIKNQKVRQSDNQEYYNQEDADEVEINNYKE